MISNAMSEPILLLDEMGQAPRELLLLQRPVFRLDE
jgi:hypothetical protein